MFQDLIYAGKPVEALIKAQYPGAIIKDASDEIHRERFELSVDTTEEEFYLFAVHKGFILCCFRFRILLHDAFQQDKLRHLLEVMLKVPDSLGDNIEGTERTEGDN